MQGIAVTLPAPMHKAPEDPWPLRIATRAIAAPAGADQEHLKLLSKLARNIMKEDFRAQLHGAKTRKEAADIISQVLSPAPATDKAAATTQA